MILTHPENIISIPILPTIVTLRLPIHPSLFPTTITHLAMLPDLPQFLTYKSKAPIDKLT
jgi:hypothetical protein